MFNKRWIIFISLALIMFSIFFVSCGEKSNNLNKQNTLLTTKLVPNERYVFIKTSIYKEKDKVGEKDYVVATISRGEKVKLIKNYEVFYQSQDGSNAPELKKISEVELTDGKKGFLYTVLLALKPIVMLEEVQAFERPDLFSRSISFLKKGSLAFIMEFADQNWVNIYGGRRLDGSNISNVWICTNYTDDVNLVRDAIDFEDATNYLDAASKLTDLETKNKYYKIASDILEKLAQKNSIISQEAKLILEKIKTE